MLRCIYSLSRLSGSPPQKGDDRMIFIDDGVIVEDCAPDDMFNSKNERLQAFLGKLESTY